MVENPDKRHPILLDLWRYQSGISLVPSLSCVLSSLDIGKNLVNRSIAVYIRTQHQNHYGHKSRQKNTNFIKKYFFFQNESNRNRIFTWNNDLTF